MMSIPHYSLDTFKTKFKKLSKLCAKYKLEQPSYELGKEWYSVSINDETGQYKVKMINIEVNSDVPRINGWECIAHIDHTENKNFLFSNEQLPEHYRTADAICEHCNVNRYRKDTYVLKNESGEYKQVGRNCLAEFLRTSAESLLRISTTLMSFCELEDYDFRNMSACEMYVDLDFYLAGVKQEIDEHGWQPRKSECPTANYVWENLYRKINKYTVKDSHHEFAKRTIHIQIMKK